MTWTPTLKPTRYPLGSQQRAFLRAMAGHKRWYDGCGWYWSTKTETERMLLSLERRGYVRKTMVPSFGTGPTPVEVWDFVDPDEVEQAEQDRLVARLVDTVARYRKESGRPLAQVPDDLLIALARAATSFFKDGDE